MAHSDTMHRSADLDTLLGRISFPAAREDLLLQAIATHATPSLIGDIRSLPQSRFANETAVRHAIADL